MTDTTNDLQQFINQMMREKIDITAFAKKGIETKVVNTFGVYCPKCGSNQVYCEVKQLRSSDEASDKIFTCLRCGYVAKNKFLFDDKSEEFKKKIKKLQDEYEKNK